MVGHVVQPLLAYRAEPPGDDGVTRVGRRRAGVETPQEHRPGHEVLGRLPPPVGGRVQPALLAFPGAVEVLGQLRHAAQPDQVRAGVGSAHHDEPVDRGEALAAGSVAVVVRLAGEHVAGHQPTHRVGHEVDALGAGDPQLHQRDRQRVGGVRDRAVVGVVEPRDRVARAVERRDHVAPDRGGMVQPVQQDHHAARDHSQAVQRRRRVHSGHERQAVRALPLVERVAEHLLEPRADARLELPPDRLEAARGDGDDEALLVDVDVDRAARRAADRLELEPAERRPRVDRPIEVGKQVRRRQAHRVAEVDQQIADADPSRGDGGLEPDGLLGRGAAGRRLAGRPALRDPPRDGESDHQHDEGCSSTHGQP